MARTRQAIKRAEELCERLTKDTGLSWAFFLADELARFAEDAHPELAKEAKMQAELRREIQRRSEEADAARRKAVDEYAKLCNQHAVELMAHGETKEKLEAVEAKCLRLASALVLAIRGSVVDAVLQLGDIPEPPSSDEDDYPDSER